MPITAPQARLDAAQTPESADVATHEPLPVDSSEPCAPLGNQLLARLPQAEFRRLQKQLQPLCLAAGETIGDAQAIFPVQAIVSLRTRHADGCAVEFASIGREGCFGFSLISGHDLPAQAVASTAGLAYALPLEQLLAEYERQGAFARLLLRQGAALLAQAAILCGCNRRHALEPQVARWLLTSFDRVRGNELVVTQEMIASLLGVRREGVTEAAGRLQRAGIIEYRRGHVFVLCRDALAERACECYGAIRGQLDSGYALRTEAALT